MVSYQDLFSVTDYGNLVITNCFYTMTLIDDIQRFLNIGISNDKIVTASNEFLYHNGLFYQNIDIPHPKYKAFLDIYNNRKEIFKNPVRISGGFNLISAHSIGTEHGYASVFSFLKTYLTKYPKKDKKVLICKNSQQGILDIVHTIIPKENIIYLELDVPYIIEEVEFCRLRYSICLFNDLYKIVDEFRPFFTLKLDVPGKHIYKKVCCAKTDKSQNVTQVGVFREDEIQKFVKINNFTLLNPVDFNEIEWINIIANARELAFTYGTCANKNIPYISEKCEKITILTPKGNFTDNYYLFKDGFDSMRRFKNAEIEVILLGDNKADEILV